MKIKVKVLLRNINNIVVFAQSTNLLAKSSMLYVPVQAWFMSIN